MEAKKVKKIEINIIMLIVVLLYYIAIIIFPSKISEPQMEITLKSIAAVIMIISIIIFEIAYKKDNGTIAIIGIETLIIAIHTLLIIHIVNIANIGFDIYIKTSIFLFSMYFLIKSMIIYTIEKKRYLNSLSDIKEIIVNEPTKKEAKKSNRKV